MCVDVFYGYRCQGKSRLERYSIGATQVLPQGRILPVCCIQPAIVLHPGCINGFSRAVGNRVCGVMV